MVSLSFLMLSQCSPAVQSYQIGNFCRRSNMALASIASIGATVSFLIYFSLPCSIAAGENVVVHSPVAGSRRPMVFPLFLSQSNSSYSSSTRSISIPHRKLQKTDSKSLPHSRMRLYDDLLRNGYYTTRLWIGTPPQMFALIVDSGSTVTYVPCSDCEQCGKHQDPKFQPELSSTYQPVKCNMDCNCDDDKEQCVYEREYAEHSSSKGVLGEDHHLAMKASSNLNELCLVAKLWRPVISTVNALMALSD